MAVPDGSVTGPGYRFDVRLQGPGETVFLDLISGADGGGA
jgi:protocatechuate 3,4-dioxygenase alpha subunit